jgi:excisionase family DNA binding protein
MTERPRADGEHYLRPQEAANRLQVTPKTLTRMGDRGEIRYIRLPRGHRRYSESDVTAILDPQPP